MLMTTSECLAKYESFYRIAQAVRRGELYKVARGVYSDTRGGGDVNAAQDMTVVLFPTTDFKFTLPV